MDYELLVSNLAQILKKKSLKICTAESCTGGGLSFYLTNLAGSSEWFERGFVTYSNEAKIEILGVRQESLDKYGAVSEQVACEMSQGALKHSRADISIAITGIAGPSGGTKDKPVGTVWFSISKKNKEDKIWREIFSGDREKIREQSIEKVLEKLIEFVSSV